MGGEPWEPKGPHGSPKDPMGGDPWEPKGPHGRGPLGAQRIPWEGNPWEPLGSPGTTEAQFEASWGLQEPTSFVEQSMYIMSIKQKWDTQQNLQKKSHGAKKSSHFHEKLGSLSFP